MFHLSYGARLEQDIFLVRSLEWLLLLRALTLVGRLVLLSRDDAQALFDYLNLIAWTTFLLKITWSLVCRYPSFLLIMNDVKSTLSRFLVFLNPRKLSGRHCYDCVQLCLKFSHTVCEEVKIRLSLLLQRCLHRCHISSELTDEVSIEMGSRSSPKYPAPPKLMVLDRGETEQKARDKDL